MSKHKVHQHSFSNYTTSKKSSPLIQTRPWTNPYQQKNDQIIGKPPYVANPPSTEEWQKNNILQRVIETRQAQLQQQAIQAKLTVGEPGDKYELEADAMASKVMSMPDTVVQKESEQKLQTKPLAQRVTPVIRLTAARNGSIQAKSNLESRLNSSKGGGSPLSNQVRSFMEPRFGADFSQVRVHTGSTAVQMSRELGAQAFTHGSDIYYGEGKAPGNNELTAHELTHVVQQCGTLQMKKIAFENNFENNEVQKTKNSLIQEPIVQCERQSWMDSITRRMNSLGRGAQAYMTHNDEGSGLARILMIWFISRGGQPYISSEWSDFMSNRPEIQRAMANKFRQLATAFAARGGDGSFNDRITGVVLNELESMRLTLNGSHRIDIEGNYEVQREGEDTIVRFTSVMFTWIDKGDLHEGTKTILNSGQQIDDREFANAGGSSFDIELRFSMPSTSIWRVSGGEARHEGGWPPITDAPVPPMTVPPSIEGSSPIVPPSIEGSSPIVPPSIGGSSPIVPPSIGGSSPIVPPSIGGSSPIVPPSIGGWPPITDAPVPPMTVTPSIEGSSPIVPPSIGGWPPITDAPVPPITVTPPITDAPAPGLEE